ncbi:ATP-binding cassette domain-containing protein [Herpetosiphon sp. NSE202]|uniref:ATP-binding cassette domain-containing protein n=1 Tax=Herpetosiphon sp. NSE202 TaxID=3351349 RepID=UPI0036269619
MELRVSNLSYCFGNTQALQKVSFAFTSGIIGLLGPNGSGKSTLLRLLATALPLGVGEICFAGRSYHADLRPLRSVLGYSPQQIELPDQLTPLRLLEYIAKLKQRAKPDCAGLLATLGLAEVASQPLSQLSGGQIRLVGISQALIGAPRLLILDEPTAGLGVEERSLVLQALARRAQECLIVLSSHVPAEIETIVTNLLVLNHGAVSFAGTAAELASPAVGLVHEIVVPIEAINGWLESGRVSSITQHGATATLRVLGEPPLGSVGVEPTMEEGYLLHLRTQTARRSASSD